MMQDCLLLVMEDYLLGQCFERAITDQLALFESFDRKVRTGGVLATIRHGSCHHAEHPEGNNDHIVHRSCHCRYLL